ncbi:MAG: hypothetical protein JNL11_07065 [Bdellovibrionaceae bacterium]|nr:hypothetical protein [Pseudobdellovibrionaceae bacterium]
MEYRSNRRPIKESDLVSEQPGFFILFLGLFFAFVVGLSVRTAAQSKWFRERLTEAIANVGADWRIQHGNVGLYFKDGIRPAIGFYAEDVKIASESRCYMKSGGFANRVRIPLSIIKYIMDGQLVSEVEIQDFKIEVTERTPICQTPSIPSEVGLAVEAKRKNQISIVDRVERNSLRNEIERVRINKLEIYYPDEKFDYFLLRDITVENRSTHPKILFMNGNIDLGTFIKSGESQKLANLKIEYNEFPEKVIKSNLLGSLREGFFSVQLVNRIDDKKFQLQTELKNVSLSMLKGFTHEFPKDLNLRSNWISLKIYAEGFVDQIKTSAAEIKDVLVNGDLGEFFVSQIVFAKGVKKAPEPFEIRMRGLDLSNIVQLFSMLKVPEQVERLGLFDGQLRVVNESNISLEGRLRDFGVIFSARGVRRVEKVDVGKLSGEWKKNKVIFEAQNMQNGYGKIGGYLRIRSDDLKAYEIDSTLKDIHLALPVAELITGSGSPLVIDEFAIKAVGRKNKLDYKATGKMKTLAHQYFELSNVGFSVVGGTEKHQDVDVKAEQWQNTNAMQKSTEKWGVLLPALITKPRIKVTQNSSGMLIKLDSQNSVRVGVAVNTDSSVDGFIATKDQEWKVYGTRDNFKIDKK